VSQGIYAWSPSSGIDTSRSIGRLYPSVNQRPKSICRHRSEQNGNAEDKSISKLPPQIGHKFVAIEHHYRFYTTLSEKQSHKEQLNTS
jgi:hypothetical protein